jgi:hypothetical protein
MIFARKESPPGQEPIEWIILIDEPLDRLEAAYLK